MLILFNLLFSFLLNLLHLIRVFLFKPFIKLLWRFHSDWFLTPWEYDFIIPVNLFFMIIKVFLTDPGFKAHSDKLRL